MTILLIAAFMIGYIFIALERPIKINKTATALATGVVCWLIYSLFPTHFINLSQIPAWFQAKIGAIGNSDLFGMFVHHQLLDHLSEIANILFFLLGAMTIVELIDTYDGFSIITEKITATKKTNLLWLVGFITFFLSAVLDNMTTAIVMVSILRKLIYEKEDRLFFAGIVVIAANAGGAFSPIGDVTTTMLWIGGQITAANIIKVLFLPSLVCLLVPLTYLSIFKMKGIISRPENTITSSSLQISSPLNQKIILIVGVCGLIFVPILKTLTGLPPFMGMIFSLSIIWITAEIIGRKTGDIQHATTHVVKALQRIDTPSILFFLGILMAVAALQSAGLLASLATHLDSWIGNQSIIVLIIGLLSSVVDNVPLVAAGMGMYHFPADSFFWEFLAYCAGTGGSILIIGSAAGVAAMGIEKIDFIWYIKKIAFLALLGYFSGAIVYILTDHFLMAI